MRTKTSFIFVIIFIMAAGAVFAESPREQLKQMVGELQKTPGDDALREKIIKLAQELKPAPAVPEEARRYLARGIAAFEIAKSAEDFKLALPEFQNAANAAPWWPDAYFNMAKVQEKIGDFKGAIASYQLYLIADPNAKDAESIRTQSYKLEFMAEQKGKEDEAKTKEDEKKLYRQKWAADTVSHLRSTYGGLVERMTVTIYHDASVNNPDAADWRVLGNSLNMDKVDPDIRPDNYHFIFSVSGADQDQLKTVVPWTKKPICLDYDHRNPETHVHRFAYCGDPSNYKDDKEFFVTFGTTTNGNPWIQVLYACENERCSGIQFRLQK